MAAQHRGNFRSQAPRNHHPYFQSLDKLPVADVPVILVPLVLVDKSMQVVKMITMAFGCPEREHGIFPSYSQN